MGISGLMHIGLYTRDMNESLKFYTEVLGFTVQWHDMVDHITGRIEAAKIVMGDCTIELVKPADLNRVHHEAGPLQHIALKVSDLPAVIQQLTHHGIVFTEEMRTISFDGGIRHCFLHGPSNERIELAEYVNI